MPWSFQQYLACVIALHCTPKNQGLFLNPHIRNLCNTSVINTAISLSVIAHLAQTNHEFNASSREEAIPIANRRLRFRRGRGPPLRANNSTHRAQANLRTPPSGYTTSAGRAVRNIINDSAQGRTIDPVCGPKPTCVCHRWVVLRCLEYTTSI
jgi:hypothetical protein